MGQLVYYRISPQLASLACLRGPTQTFVDWWAQHNSQPPSGQVRVFLLRLFDGPFEKQQYMDALSTTFKAWSNEVGRLSAWLLLGLS